MTLALRLAADAVALLHLAFVLFVVFGGLLVARWPRLAGLHLPAMAWGVLIEFAGWTCPLTPLENGLRHVVGQAGYAGGFIDHYLWPLLYPAGLTRERQWALGAGVLILNGAVYGLLLARRWRRARAADRRGPRCAAGDGALTGLPDAGEGDPETTTERETLIELDTLVARLDARLAELNAQAAECEPETRNPAADLATQAERQLETVRAVQEEVQRIREWVFHLQRHRE